MFELIVGIIIVIMNPDVTYLWLLGSMVLASIVLHIIHPEKRNFIISSIQSDGHYIQWLITSLVLIAIISGVIFGITSILK